MDNHFKPRLHATQCCLSCGNRLDVHQAVKGGYCSEPQCLIAQAVAPDQEKQALDKIANDYAQAHYGARTAVARVPSMERSLVKTDPKWLARFRRHLRESIRQAVSKDSNSADTQTMSQTVSEATDDAASESAAKYNVEDKPGNSVSLSCELCRGRCCEQGAGHAFLFPGFIQSRLEKNPGLSAVAMYKEYLQHLPSHSYEGACAYQASKGCALPREIRSNVCNTYECPSRLAFAQMLQHNDEAPIAIIAMDEKIVRRTALTRKE